MERRNGFTVVEMLTVLVLAGIIATVILRPTAEHLQRAAVDGAVREFVQAQRKARASAQQRGRRSELRMDTAAGRYWIEIRSDALPDTVGPVYKIGSPVDVTSDFTILCYDARGLPATGLVTGAAACDGPTASVIFASGPLADTVRIGASGRLEVQ